MTILQRLAASLSGEYTVERELGSGGMAHVYLAEDVKHHRKVALKVLRPELAQNLGADRFVREIRIAANLEHPHILTLIDSGEADGLLYYVMPYIDGESLRQKLDREGALPVEEASRLLAQVADALAHAHQHGVVHRDIKPDNILISGRHAEVMDFGVAKAVAEATGGMAMTETGMALGTPSYMSPEQAAADPHVDHRADIYALGVMAYEMLTGQPPFIGATPQQVLAAHVTEAPKPIGEMRAATPEALGQLVMKCLEKRPADRWQTTADMVPLLESASISSGSITPFETKPHSAVSQRNRSLIGVAIAAAAIIAAVSVVMNRSGGTVGSGLDANMLAVAPFDVIGEGLDLWSEGTADLLTHQLDGAGPLRATPPSVVVKQWQGRADAASAAQLGNNLGAGLVVFGRIVAIGGDSVRISTSLYDVASDAALSTFEVEGPKDRIPTLSDGLAVELLDVLISVRTLGVVRLSSLGSTSPAAIREFLRGEQFYRHFHLDSALHHYRRAVEQDSSFALAWNRIGWAGAWYTGTSMRNNPNLLRAGTLNHGLSARESTLIRVDSLWATMTEAGDSTTWALTHEILQVLGQAVALYPNDPQAHYRLGEIRHHYGWIAGVSVDETIEAFANAVTLDSGLSVAYPHLPKLYGRAGDIEGVRTTTAAYLALAPTGFQALVARLMSGLMEENPEGLELDTVPRTVLLETARALFELEDQSETALRLARAVDRTAPPGQPHPPPFELLALAYRGRLDESLAKADRSAGLYYDLLLGEMALLRGLGGDSVSAMIARTDAPGLLSQWLVPILVERGDTAAIRRWRVANEGAGDAAGVQAFDAYLALAMGDTALAVATFDSLPPWRCNLCFTHLLTHARLLAATGRPAEAADLLHGTPNTVYEAGQSTDASNLSLPRVVIWYLERARVNETLGRRDGALRDYSYVAQIWHRADAVLQPYVDEAREALVRLSGEN